MYLLSDSPEAQEMRNKITMMLEGGDMGQVLLAFQLLEGGGVHPEHLTHILFFWFWYGSSVPEAKAIETHAGELFQNFVPQAWQIRLRAEDMFKTIRMAIERIDEQHFTELIESGSQAVGFDGGTLAALTLYYLGVGADYLLRHNARPTSWVLKQMHKHTDSLNFSDFQLETLPEGIEHCGDIDTLNIIGNPLKSLPKGIEKARIANIIFDYNDLHEAVLAQLMQYFPDIMTNCLYAQAMEAKRQAGKCLYPVSNPHDSYLKAIEIFEKTVQCRLDYAEVWGEIGACWVFYGEPEKGKEALYKAIEWFRARLNGYTTQGYGYNITAGYNMYGISCAYALLQDREKAFACLRTAIDYDQYYCRAAKDECWQGYKHESAFLLLTDEL